MFQLGALHYCCIRDRKTKSALNASRHRLKSYSLLTLFTPNIQYPHTHTHAPIHSLTSHMQAHTCAWARVQLSPVFRAFMLFLQDLNKIPYVSGDELTSFRGGRKKRRQQRQKCSAGNCKCGCKISQYKHESDGDRVVSDHHSGVKCMQMYVCVVVCYVA